MRQLYRTGVMIFLLMWAFSLAPGATRGNESSHSERPIRVGVLASLTGTWSSLGLNTVAALELAADQIEAADHSHGDRARVRL